MENICFLAVPCGLFLFVPLIWCILVFNRFVRLRQHLRDSWAGIDVELKRRYDLIPNLVATVKGYARHEQEVFQEVTEARSRAVASEGAPGAQARDERELVSGLGKLMAVAEAYPDLKADGQFKALQEELVNTEDRLAAARRFYNGNVRTLNAMCESFPTNIVASLASIKTEDFFEVEESIRSSVPKV